jgi:hypothetical protein
MKEGWGDRSAAISIIQRHARPRLTVGVAFRLADVNGAQGPKNSERLQQPKHNRDDYNHIQDALYLAIHWNVGVHQP